MTAAATESPATFAVDGMPRGTEPGWKDVPEYRMELVRDRSIPFRKAYPNSQGTPLQNKAANILHEMLDKSPMEQFVALMLNADLEVIGAHRVTIGDLEHVEAPMAAIFRAAIVAACPRIIISHCHPTGRAIASDADLLMTMAAVEAGNMLGIEVLDHIIVAPDGSDFSVFDHQDLIDVALRKRVQDKLYHNPIAVAQEMARKRAMEGDPKMPSLARIDVAGKREKAFKDVTSRVENEFISMLSDFRLHDFGGRLPPLPRGSAGPAPTNPATPPRKKVLGFF